MTAMPDRAAVRAALFVRPLRQAPRLEPLRSQRRISRPARTAPKAARRSSSARSRKRAPCSRCLADFLIGIVPASDTGAVEMAMWSMLGARPVTMLAWESFGEGWVTDVAKQLKLKDATVVKAPYGKLPDLSEGRSELRHRIHLERHDLRRARAECGLDRGRPRGRHDLRCDLRRLRPAARLGKSSMSSPSRGRRRSAAKRRTAC